LKNSWKGGQTVSAEEEDERRLLFFAETLFFFYRTNVQRVREPTEGIRPVHPTHDRDEGTTVCETKQGHSDVANICDEARCVAQLNGTEKKGDVAAGEVSKIR
jgi:hypothetical protein